jgi:hypothetical protein
MATAVEARAGAFAALAGTFALPEQVTTANAEARELAERLLRRGHDDGTVREDITTLDLTHVVEMFSRYPRRTDEDDHARRRMLTLTLDGLRATHTGLPAPQLGWDDYQRIWDEPNGQQ